jgi:hypothetical protein
MIKEINMCPAFAMVKKKKKQTGSYRRRENPDTNVRSFPLLQSRHKIPPSYF